MSAVGGFVWPLLFVEGTIVHQVVPHTFLRTRLFTHVFGGGTAEASAIKAALRLTGRGDTQVVVWAGDGATGEAAVSGFYVTSSDVVSGSGTANTSSTAVSVQGKG